MTSKINDFFNSPQGKLGNNGREYHIDLTSLRLSEAMALQNLVLQSKAKHTLEIGLALGASAIAIAEALERNGDDTLHVALELYQASSSEMSGFWSWND